MTTFNYDITDGNASFEGLNTGDTLNITGGLDDTALGGVLGFLLQEESFIEITDDGNDTTIGINTLGLGNNYTDVVVLEGYTGHGDSLQDMINGGYLVI